MSRVGAAENAFLNGGDLATVIISQSFTDSRQFDQALTNAFEKIGRMAKMLKAPKSIIVSGSTFKKENCIPDLCI